MEIIHALFEALLNSILITGLVVIMMMMIECFNIESHGDFLPDSDAAVRARCLRAPCSE